MTVLGCLLGALVIVLFLPSLGKQANEGQGDPLAQETGQFHQTVSEVLKEPAPVCRIYENGELIGILSDPIKGIKKEWKFILVFGVGAVIGILAFGKLMNWLLERYPAQSAMFFVGVILGSLPMLLKKENILQSAIVEVTRNADVFLSDLQFDDDEDSRQKMSSLLSKRKREMPVRLQIHGKLTDQGKALLMRKMRVPERFFFTQTMPFDLSFRSCISGPKNFKYEEHRPAREIGLKKSMKK